MKLSSLLLLSLACSGVVLAEVPTKPPLTRYAGLWTNSPFTSKPPEAGPQEAVNRISGFALGGISPIQGGYRVTLLNRTNPEERTIVESNDASSGFKILTVNRKPGDPLGTTVRLSSGGDTGVVAFDEKLLTLKATPVERPNPQPNQPAGTPPPVAPGQPQQPAQPNGNANGGQRQPRPRVLPPSNNGQQGQRQNQAVRPQRQINR